MKRREFITLLGGAAAAWPLAARAQQPAMPVIGFLDAASPDAIRGPSARISPGPEGDRLCRGRERRDRIPLGRGPISIGCRRWRPNLVRRQVAVIAAIGTPRGARGQGGNHDDPHRLQRRRRPGQAWSCRQPRPAGRQRDRHQFFQRLNWWRSGWSCCASWCPRRLAWPCSSIRPMLRPRPRCGTWKRLRAPWGCKSRSSMPAPAARSMRPSQRLRASGPTRCSSAPTPFFNSRRVQLVNSGVAPRASRRHIRRANYAEAGGLMSYGARHPDAYRQVGVYTGRILKGAKPADLPVVQSTKFELVIKLKTARALGLDSAADAARPRRRGDRMIRARVHHAARRRGAIVWSNNVRVEFVPR